MATPNNQFRLRLYSNTPYNFTVHWGDGTSDIFNQTTPVYQGATGSSSTWSTQISTISASWPGLTHIYTTPGKYTVSISENVPGGFPGLQYAGVDDGGNWDAFDEFNNDAKKVTAISQWGSVNWNPTKAMVNSFEGCINLKDVVTDGGTSTLSALTNFSQAWRNCTSLSSFGSIDTSKGTNFNLSWDGCNKLTHFPLISTQNANSVYVAWRNCTSMKSFPQLNMSKVNDIRYAWTNCVSLTSFPLIEFSGGPYIGIYNAQADGEDVWGNCSGLKTFPNIQSLSGIKYFVRTWMGCTGLTGFEYKNFLNTIFLENTWNGCTGFTQFPYISCDNVQGFQGAWNSCSNLTSFPLINTLSATVLNNTWNNCYSLTSFPDLSTQNVIDMKYAWRTCISLSSFPFINTSKVKYFDIAWGVWEWGKIMQLREFPLIDTSAGESFYYTWNGNHYLKDFPLISLSSALTLEGAWNDCRALTTFPVLSAPKCTNFSFAWNSCGSLSSFPLIFMPKGQNFRRTWSYCNNLSTSSFPALSTPDATSFQAAFAWGRGRDDTLSFVLQSPLTAIPDFLLNSSNTAKVTNFNNTWRGCGNLKEFPVNINMLSATSVAGAWADCISLTNFPSVMLSSVRNFGAAYGVGDDGTLGGENNIPLLNAGFDAWINASGAWMNTTLTSFPMLCTQNGEDFSNAWYGMKQLKTFPKLDISKGKKFLASWRNCRSLRDFPSLDFSSAEILLGTFSNMTSLTSFPEIDTSNCRFLGAAWHGCTALNTFPYIDTVSATSLRFSGYAESYGGAWENCWSLSSFPMIDTSNVTNFKYAWRNCYSLSASPFPQLNMSKMGSLTPDSGYNENIFTTFYDNNVARQNGTGGDGCFQGVKLQTQSYSALLTSLCATNFNSNVQFHGGLSNFNQAGKDARDYLVTTKGWTIGGSGSLEL